MVFKSTVSLISSGLLRIAQSLEHVSKNVLIHHGGSNCSLSPSQGMWGHLPPLHQHPSSHRLRLSRLTWPCSDVCRSMTAPAKRDHLHNCREVWSLLGFSEFPAQLPALWCPGNRWHPAIARALKVLLSEGHFVACCLPGPPGVSLWYRSHGTIFLPKTWASISCSSPALSGQALGWSHSPTPHRPHNPAWKPEQQGAEGAAEIHFILAFI